MELLDYWWCKLRILIDIGHPGHVHLFKNLIRYFTNKKHKVIITTKDDKDIVDLLRKYNFNYINLGKKGSGLFGKILKQCIFDIKLLYYLYKYGIDIALGTSISISHACLFHKSKSFVFNEDDKKSAPFFAKAAYPFAYRIITPTSLREDYGKKHIKVNSLHELAYLHPDNFKPDIKELEKVGIKKGESFFILRFNAFKAHHDKDIKGLSKETKRNLIGLLEEKGRVLITTEGKIDNEFRKYQMKISPEKIHHFLNYCDLFIGDSQTMTLEAAVLGVPAIRCNDFVGRCPAIEELEEKYGLTYGFKPKDSDKMLRKIKELLNKKNLKKEWQEKKKRLLKDKIDFNAFMIKLIENFKKR